MIYKFLV